MCAKYICKGMIHMYRGRTRSPLPVIFAVILGIALAAILYYVTGAALTVILWIGIGISALLISILLISLLFGTGGSREIERALNNYGWFFIICVIGTLIIAAILLTLQTLLVAGSTSLTIIALVFLFGFFLGGTLATLAYVIAGSLENRCRYIGANR